MSTPSTSSADTRQAPDGCDSHRAHRRIVIACGTLAVAGAALSLLADPAWVGLAALGGLALVLLPDRNCCGR